MPAVLACPGLELTAVCTSRLETARAAAARWNVPRWYGEYQRLLADPDIDLVTIAVRVRLHLPIARAAIEARKMVYCEWPLCLTASDAYLLASLASAHGVSAGVGLQGRFAPAVAYARDLIRSGAIGRPLSFLATQQLSRFDVESDRWWLAREEEGSGALRVATGHLIDVVESLLSPVEALAGTRATMRPSAVFSDTGEPLRCTASDTVACTARLKGGCLGSIYTTYLAEPPLGFSVQVFGEDGQLALRGPGYVSFSPATLHVAPKGSSRLRRLRVPRRFARQLTLDVGDPSLNVALALEALSDSARSGQRFRPNFEDAAHIHGIVEHLSRARLRRVGCQAGRRR